MPSEKLDKDLDAIREAIMLLDDVEKQAVTSMARAIMAGVGAVQALAAGNVTRLLLGYPPIPWDEVRKGMPPESGGKEVIA